MLPGADLALSHHYFAKLELPLAVDYSPQLRK